MREEIAGIDRSIILLVAARRRAVQELMALKRVRQFPLVDPDQELRVLARARWWARQNGAPADLAERVMRLLIREGKQTAISPIARGLTRPRLTTVYLLPPTVRLPRPPIGTSVPLVEGIPTQSVPG